MTEAYDHDFRHSLFIMLLDFYIFFSKIPIIVNITMSEIHGMQMIHYHYLK